MLARHFELIDASPADERRREPEELMAFTMQPEALRLRLRLRRDPSPRQGTPALVTRVVA